MLKQKYLALDSTIELFMLHEQSEPGIKEQKKEEEIYTPQGPSSNCGGNHIPDRKNCPAFSKHCNACGKLLQVL